MTGQVFPIFRSSIPGSRSRISNLNSRCVVSVLLVALLSASASAQFRPRSRDSRDTRGNSAPTTGPSASDDDLLVQRNIFLRNRPPRPTTRPVSTAPFARPDAPRPERSLIFRGVVDQGGQSLAYVENTATGEILRAGVGDPIASGFLRGLAFDALQYEAGGSFYRIEIGQTFEGGAATQAAAPTSAPTGGGDILEQMRRRRLEGR